MPGTIDQDNLTRLMTREQERFVQTHPASQALHQRALASLNRGVPMVWMARWAGAFPLFVTSAQGSHFTDADIALLSKSNTVATFLPGAEFSTRSKYPDARRMLEAGVDLAIASDCNPGSSYTNNMQFIIALAVRECFFTPEQALWSATAGGAKALRRSDVGVLKVGANADLLLLNSPSYIHLAYRPGVNQIEQVWRNGERIK